MKQIIALILIAIGLAAHAETPTPIPEPKPVMNVSTALAKSFATADALADAAANVDVDNIAEGGAGGDGGDATASNGPITVGAPVASVNYRQRSKVKIENVPSISAPGIASSHPCAYGGSASLAIAGAGVSGGKQKIDPACVRRELIRIGFAAGLMKRSTFMWCQDAVAAGSFTNIHDCLTFDTDVKLPPGDVDEDVVVHVRVEDGHQKCEAVGPGAVLREYTDDGVLVVYECLELKKGS